MTASRISTPAWGSLPAVLADLRRRGYVFRNDLEERTAGLKDSWPSTRRQVQAAITQTG